MTEQQASSQVRYLEIEPERQGQRLDNFLFTTLRSIPKSRIYRMLRSGEVRVNKKRAKQTYRLVAGDVIRIPPLRQAPAGSPPRLSPQFAQSLSKAILFESTDLLILNKPSGLAVHGGSGLSFGAIEALRVLRPDGKQLELVHRLDRDTSGCLMLAKNRKTLRALHEQLQTKSLAKTYLALVHGAWPKHLSRVDAPLQKNELSSGERIVKVSQHGKPASTVFSVRQRFDAMTLVEVSPVTGRTHQIRVHALYAGHAIAGDVKYASSEQNKLSKSLGLNRLFLHAHSLAFSLGDEHIEVQAPLDDRLIYFLEKLSK